MTDMVGAPSRVLIVGAGIVGLSCAWSLQEHGVDVVVVDGKREGAGASWRNAGYLAPALTVPLPEPAILRSGARALLDPGSAVHLPLRPDLGLAQFMVRLVGHCTSRAWDRAMAAYRPLNDQILSSYDRQRDGGVQAVSVEADVVAGFRRPRDAAGLLHEIQGVLGSGQKVQIELMTATEARAYEPHLSTNITMAVRLLGQRYLTPFEYVTALADSVRRRGGKIVEQTKVTAVLRQGGRVVVRGPSGDLDADAAILATGSWLNSLARAHGVALRVFAGRGYSFTLPCAEPVRGPMYFPATRVAVTPEGDRLRLSGVMEFGRPDDRPDPRRIPSMVKAVKPLLDGVDWDRRQDEWMGARPLTVDGIPLVGSTRTPGVYVAGGHGMWGMTLGPLTGHLLAGQIVSGRVPDELRPLDPCR
jgi:D-amino-acid dehydrogenase